MVADNGVVIHYVANNPGAKFKTVSDKAFAPEHYGIALKKGNAELLAKAQQGPGRHQGRRQLRPDLREYFGAAAGRRCGQPPPRK